MSEKAFIAAMFVVVLAVGVYLYQHVLPKFPPTNFSRFLNYSSSSTTAPPAAPGEEQAPATPSGPPASPPPPVPSGSSSALPEGISPEDIPQGFSASQISSRFHQVRIGSISASYELGSYGFLSLVANFDGTSTVDISSWLLKSNRGTAYVPKAVAVMDAQGLAPETDIFLGSGQVLNIYLGIQSPIGKNFRLNKCAGYLANNTTFTPDLPRICPTPNRSDIEGASGICYDYIGSVSSCSEIPSNPPVPEDDITCRAYLKNFTYKGCVETSRFQSDFLNNEWWAWMDSRFLDARHDRVLLLDRKGLLVDSYEY